MRLHWHTLAQVPPQRGRQNRCVVPFGSGRFIRQAIAGERCRYGLCDQVLGNAKSWATTLFGAPTGAKSTGS